MAQKIDTSCKSGYKPEHSSILVYSSSISKKNMENLINKLNEFQIYKQLILNGETDGRNILVETKDGTHAILPQKIKPKFIRRKAIIPHIPGLRASLDEIERVTIFVDGKEYEFIACQ
jgi:predicted ribosome-associated RNA-binding protein Tma20